VSSPNSQEARVERFVRLAHRLGLTVHGFELLTGRGFRVLTQPLSESEAAAPAKGVGKSAYDKFFDD
jgi:hypothetical protein